MTDQSQPGYHGYRFLVDAKSTRQYAVRYDNGTPQPPIQVFAKDAREEGLKPGETVFAFDDESETKVENGRVVVGVQVWQMTANAQGVLGKGAAFKRRYVEYNVSYEPDGTDFRIVYSLSDASAAQLSADGVSGLPVQFDDRLDSQDPAVVRRDGKISINPRLGSAIAFPPHQPSGAALARHNIEMLPETNPLPLPIPTNVNTAPRPRTDFPGVANPVTGDTPAPRPPRVPRTLDKPKVPDAALEAVIKQFCEDLSEKAAQGRLDPVVGRDSETDQALKVMSRRKQASLCFTGDAGVGKTAMFSAIAQRLQDDPSIPASLKGARVLQLDLQAMNAGAQFRGQFEAKLKPLIDGLKEREGYFKGRKIIIAIDEIHSQLTAGMASGGTDAGNMMKPFLTAQGISVMGTTTADEYRKHIEKDPAMSSRFEQLVLTEPKPSETKQILKRLWPSIRDHHELDTELSDADFDYIVTMTTRYAPNDANPRKGEKVLDMAASGAQFRGATAITRDDVIKAVAQMAKLSPEFLGQSDHARFLQMEKDLPSKVLGQEPAIQKVVDGLIGARSGLNDPNQPWGCFVLQGPTGTGKTELCKELAKYLFGTEEAMIKLDMSEYAHEHTVSRLIGTTPGYVGFDSSAPVLTEQIRQRPYSILLLDEIEKAHPNVFNVFLSILNDGKMTDNHGKTVLFNNVIVVMTTNLGAKEALGVINGSDGMNFGSSLQGAFNDDTADRLKRLEAAYTSKRNEFFRPEMVNRIEELGGFVTFAPLSQGVISNLVDREVDKVGDRLSQTMANYALEGSSDEPTTTTPALPIKLEVSPGVRAKLSKDGYNPTMGARPMRKVVREQIANPLGKWLMGNKEEIAAFVAKHGSAKLVIEAVGANFAPKLAKAEAKAAVSNDNKAAVKKPKAEKKAAPKV